VKKLKPWLKNLLENDKRCDWIAFVIDDPFRVGCADSQMQPSILAFTKKDVRKMLSPESLVAVNRITAITWCKDAAKKSLNYPATFSDFLEPRAYSADLLQGNARIELNFTAKNAFGVLSNLRMECVYEGTKVVREEMFRR